MKKLRGIGDSILNFVDKRIIPVFVVLYIVNVYGLGGGSFMSPNFHLFEILNESAFITLIICLIAHIFYLLFRKSKRKIFLIPFVIAVIATIFNAGLLLFLMSV